jgi:predicted MFS family arabinose efflux permease
LNKVGSMSGKPWIMLSVLLMARTAMGFQFQTVASIGPSLMESLSIDNARIGVLIGLYLLPGLPIALPSGIIGQRFGARHVVLAGLVMMMLGGAIAAVAVTFPVAAAGRIISGTGGVLMNVMLTKLVADWFDAGKMATAMAVLITGWPLGIALGLAVGPHMMLAFGGAAVLQLATGLAALALGLFIVLYRDPPDLPRPAAVRFSLGLTRYELRMVSLAGAIWTTYNAGYIVLVSFTPSVFAARGYSIEQSGWIVSILSWAMMPMIPAGGYLADRLGRPDLLMAGGFIVAAAGIVAMGYSDAPVTWLIVVALASGLPSGAMMALPASVMRPEVRAGGMGIYYTLYYAGVALLPALAGMARDRTGSVTAPMLFAAAMLALALLFLIVFRISEHPPHRAAIEVPAS